MTITLAGLTWLAATGRTDEWDRKATMKLQKFRPQWWKKFMYMVSWPGYPPQTIWIYAVLLGTIWKRNTHWGRVAGKAFLGTVATGYILKFLVNRKRPADEGIEVLHRGLEGGKLSFPAGHIQALAVLAGLRIREKRNLAEVVGLGGLVALMSVSRIYLGEHWTSDVLGALLVAGIWIGVV